MRDFQIPNNLDPLARIGAYFRDKQLKKALSIVVLPGQATGKINDVVDILQTVDASNKLVPVGTLADCQDTVAKWWSAVLLASANTMLDQENQTAEQQKLHKIIERVPYKANTKTSKYINESMGYENKLANVIKATMESYRMIGCSSYTIRDQLEACDDATISLEEITENLNQRQEEQYQLDKEEKTNDDSFAVLKVTNDGMIRKYLDAFLIC